MLAGVLATDLADPEAGRSVAGEDLHHVPVARKVNGGPSIELELQEVEPGSNGSWKIVGKTGISHQ